jgi:hypothetical protein
MSQFRKLSKSIIVLMFLFCGMTLNAKTVETDVLIVGASASGTSAALQAARMGVKVVVVEDTPWAGGMLTSAGVSCTDGNHLLPSGIWGEYRQHIYDYYGGAKNVFTGWVSHTLYEPSVGNRIWKTLISDEKNITMFYKYFVKSAIMDGNKIEGAVFESLEGYEDITVKAKVVIDATELGDLLPLSNTKYFLGQDSKSQTNEEGAPDEATDIIQDITYVAILKDYGKGADKTIEKPNNYDEKNYYGTCKELSFGVEAIHTCNHMLNYGRLPNNKYMINWPIHGNDYYLNLIEKPYKERLKLLQQAKDFTLGWVYFIQTKGGYKHLGLADDEFATDDKLAYIPYHRESRRVDGLIQLRNKDVVDIYKSNNDYYKTAITVGDYPLDLHHDKTPREIFYKIEPIHSFSIPYECMLPKTTENLIVAEKSISVSHIVNGCTRLQPVVIGLGQAAGAASALAVKHNLSPKQVNVRELQQQLLDSKCWLSPVIDVTPSSKYFKAVQRVLLSGHMKLEAISEAWQNKSFFYPEKNVTKEEFNQLIKKLKDNSVESLGFEEINNFKTTISQTEALRILKKLKLDKSKLSQIKTLRGAKLKRKELALWIDTLFNPFDNIKLVR